MTFEQLNILSQMIASLAVVVSLIYLAIQTRQVARGQKAMMHHARTEEITAHLMRASERDLSSAFVKAAKGERLDDIEFQQLLTFVFPIFDGIAGSFTLAR